MTKVINADRSSDPGSISRRAFMKSLAIAAAGSAGAVPIPAFGTGGPAASGAKKKTVVGAHLWVYAAPQPRYDPTPALAEAFADMKWAGLDCIELMHQALMHDDAVERIGELSKKHALPVIGTSFEAPMWDREKHAEILKTAETLIPRLAKVGGRTLGTSVGHPTAPKTPEQLDAQAEMVRKLMALAKDHGIVLNLHNHTYEVENNEHDLRGTLARIPEAKLGPDLNWLVRGGVDPVDFIKRYGDRIIFLHLRDENADGTWSEALGEGVMDYVAIGRALKEAKFSGDAMIELAHEKSFKLTRPLRESWKMSREYVRKTLGF